MVLKKTKEGRRIYPHDVGLIILKYQNKNSKENIV